MRVGTCRPAARTAPHPCGRRRSTRCTRSGADAAGRPGPGTAAWRAGLSRACRIRQVHQLARQVLLQEAPPSQQDQQRPRPRPPPRAAPTPPPAPPPPRRSARSTSAAFTPAHQLQQRDDPEGPQRRAGQVGEVQVPAAGAVPREDVARRRRPTHTKGGRQTAVSTHSEVRYADRGVANSSSTAAG